MGAACSENPVSGSGSVDICESFGSFFVKETLGFEALVLIETIGSHAGLESVELTLAESLKDGLTRRTFIFTRESVEIIKFELLSAF